MRLLTWRTSATAKIILKWEKCNNNRTGPISAYLARQLLELSPMQGQWHWEAVELLLRARKLLFPSLPLLTGVATDLPCSLNNKTY